MKNYLVKPNQTTTKNNKQKTHKVEFILGDYVIKPALLLI